MPIFRFDSLWFQSYSRAVIESDPIVSQALAEEALRTIHEARSEPDLKEDEREAIAVAVVDLGRLARDK
ncbi:MAG: hypothetical protein ACRD3P_09660 [Terriglobales bacterium]